MKYTSVYLQSLYGTQSFFWFKTITIVTKIAALNLLKALQNNFLWPQVWFYPLSLRFILYEGRAAGFEPELVKLAALPRFQ
jgi:hypothetical protein